MVSVESVTEGKDKIAVVGLGYVGLPLAAAFGKTSEVIGFDISEKKIAELKDGFDATGELTGDELSATTIDYTLDSTRLAEARFLVVTVPTPIDDFKKPDLRPVEAASRTIGCNLTKGSIVVFESTVYPGVTEEVCVPILEAESGLKCGVDFKVGFPPPAPYTLLAMDLPGTFLEEKGAKNMGSLSSWWNKCARQS